VLPTGAGAGVSWSPDSTYLSIAHASSPFVTTYKRSGDVFTKLANPATLPGTAGFDVSWSPDGRYLAVGNNNASTPYFTVYKRSGDVLTVIDYPSTVAAALTAGVDWSPDGKYLAMALGSTPFVYVYKSILGPVAGAAIKVPLGP